MERVVERKVEVGGGKYSNRGGGLGGGSSASSGTPGETGGVVLLNVSLETVEETGEGIHPRDLILVPEKKK